MLTDILNGSVPMYLILRVLTGDSIGGVSDWNFWLLVAAALSVGATAAHFSRRADQRAGSKRTDASTTTFKEK